MRIYNEEQIKYPNIKLFSELMEWNDGFRCCYSCELSEFLEAIAVGRMDLAEELAKNLLQATTEDYGGTEESNDRLDKIGRELDSKAIKPGGMYYQVYNEKHNFEEPSVFAELSMLGLHGTSGRE